MYHHCRANPTKSQAILPVWVVDGYPYFPLRLERANRMVTHIEKEAKIMQGVWTIGHMIYMRGKARKLARRSFSFVVDAWGRDRLTEFDTGVTTVHLNGWVLSCHLEPKKACPSWLRYLNAGVSYNPIEDSPSKSYYDYAKDRIFGALESRMLRRWGFTFYVQDCIPF